MQKIKDKTTNIKTTNISENEKVKSLNTHATRRPVM